MTADLFGPEWCAQALALWPTVSQPVLVEPVRFSYAVQFGVPDGPLCQFQAKEGALLWWRPGNELPDEQIDFDLQATPANWEKVATGKLDPVGAVAAKRIHMRKGLMEVVIREAEAFKKTLTGFGQIPTSW